MIEVTDNTHNLYTDLLYSSPALHRTSLKVRHVYEFRPNVNIYYISDVRTSTCTQKTQKNDILTWTATCNEQHSINKLTTHYNGSIVKLFYLRRKKSCAHSCRQSPKNSVSKVFIKLHVLKNIVAVFCLLSKFYQNETKLFASMVQ